MPRRSRGRSSSQKIAELARPHRGRRSREKRPQLPACLPAAAVAAKARAGHTHPLLSARRARPRCDAKDRRERGQPELQGRRRENGGGAPAGSPARSILRRSACSHPRPAPIGRESRGPVTRRGRGYLDARADRVCATPRMRPSARDSTPRPLDARCRTRATTRTGAVPDGQRSSRVGPRNGARTARSCRFSKRSVLNSTVPVKVSGVSSNPSARSNFDVPVP